MRQELIRTSLIHRVTQKTNLLMVLLAGGLLGGFRLFIDRTNLRIADLVLPFVFLILHLALAPIPWQWKAGIEARRPFFRRFFTALVFNAIWITGMVILNTTISPMRHHPHPPQNASEEARQRQPDLDRPAPRAAEDARQPPPDLDMASPREAPERFGPRPDRGLPFPELGLGLLNLVFALVFGWELAEKELTEARERRTAGLLRQSQARALRSQLDPHVLYNALNGISELIHEDPLAAEEVVARLATLYRMLTDYAKTDLATLGEERKIVEAYLSMEQMRLGERLRVEWEWPEWADALQAPPLFLQTLVENAIKHGISPLDEGGELHIRCSREGAATCLRVANTGMPPTPSERQGVGLENLAARLDLWNDMNGTFSLKREQDWTVAFIRWTPRSKS
nr:histidine kinase [uncultured Holophaga sp.]